MPEVFTERGHIICEGDADKAFLSALLADRQIAGYQISYPQNDNGVALGNSGFAQRLRALTAAVLMGPIERIAIVTDSDESPDETFKLVRKQIKEANGKLRQTFPVPNEQGEVAQQGRIKLVVLTIPGAKKRGNLETLLLDSARKVQPGIFACVTQFAECAGIDTWRSEILAKARLRLMIAACCADHPDSSLRYIWSEANKPLDIKDQCFNQVATWLSDFVAS